MLCWTSDAVVTLATTSPDVFRGCRARTPWAVLTGVTSRKRERDQALQSVGTLFGQYAAGYLGSSVERRGKNAEQEAVFSLIELQDLLDDWVVTGWQTPHEGLCDPLSPARSSPPTRSTPARRLRLRSAVAVAR